jgi:arylsulfatase A-like enzyme
LEQSGELQHTLIIFSSDHGLAMGSHGLMGKQNQYEHTCGVPLIMAGPGIPVGKRITAQCYLRDLFPTVCEMAGIPIPPTVQGTSLMPVLRGEKAEVHDAVFGYFTDAQRMIRTADGWKLISYPKIKKLQLFNVTNDPYELHDLAEEPAQQERIKKMQEQLEAWQKAQGDPLVHEHGP